MVSGGRLCRECHLDCSGRLSDHGVRRTPPHCSESRSGRRILKTCDLPISHPEPVGIPSVRVVFVLSSSTPRRVPISVVLFGSERPSETPPTVRLRPPAAFRRRGLLLLQSLLTSLEHTIHKSACEASRKLSSPAERAGSRPAKFTRFRRVPPHLEAADHRIDTGVFQFARMLS
jgi:hypothetical protein